MEGVQKVPELAMRVERSGEVVAWAENAELLEFVVRVVEHNFVA